MSQTAWTIEYDGVEKAAADWGLNAEPQLTLATQAPKKFSWRMADANAVDDPPIPFEGEVIIRQNRIGDGEAWGDAGGGFIFIGRQTLTQAVASPDQQGLELVFEDTWYDLENTAYRQTWFNVPFPFTRVYLFQDPAAPATNFHMSVADQLAAIIEWAAACGVNIAVGEIDNDQLMPWYPVRGISCAEAIRTVLKFFPGMKCWIDDSSGTPTFHCRQRENLTAINLPFGCWLDEAGAVTTDYSEAARLHRSSRIRAMRELVPPGVVIQYQSNDEVDGVSGVFVDNIVYPSGVTGNELRAIVVPIDLRGGSANHATAKVVAATFDPFNLDYWRGDEAAGLRGKLPHLSDADVSDLDFVRDSMGNALVTITDKNGGAVNLATYPNEYKSGEIYTWMRDGDTPINLLSDVKVEVQFKFKKKRADGSTIDRAKNHKHVLHIKLTNSPVGTTRFSSLKSLTGGESPIAGLEEEIFNDRRFLQHEGTHEIEEVGMPAIIGPFNRLNLIGGRADWETMNADIAEVTIQFFKTPGNVNPGAEYRHTRISLGPAKYLSPMELNSYLQLFRGRIQIDNPNIRLTGADGGSGLNLEGDSPTQDTVPAIAEHEKFSTSSTDEDGEVNGLITLDASTLPLIDSLN